MRVRGLGLVALALVAFCVYSGGPGGGAGSYAGAGGNQVPNGKAYEITRKDDSQGRLATVHIRYQTPDRQRAPEQARDVVEPRQAASSSRLALAGTVAEFAEVLKHSYWARGITLKQVADAANTRLAGRSDQQVQELLGLLQKAAALEDVPRPVADGT